MTDTAALTINPRKINVSIRAKATNVLPYNLSPSSGFLELAMLKNPNNTPLPNAPNATGIIVKPNKMILLHFISMMENIFKKKSILNLTIINSV